MEEHRVTEFVEVDSIIAASSGDAGARTFFLEVTGLLAGPEAEKATIRVKLEKGQVLALASELDRLVSYLASEMGEDQEEVHRIIALGSDRDDGEPLAFAAGEIALDYDPASDKIILHLGEFGGGEDSRSVIVRADRPRMRALAVFASRSIEGGRPVCPFCTLPIDPDGHDCPARNGHKRSGALG